MRLVTLFLLLSFFLVACAATPEPVDMSVYGCWSGEQDGAVIWVCDYGTGPQEVANAAD